MKGFRQQYDVNFDKIFSPVGKMTTLQFLLSVVATADLELIQLNVKTSFLHGKVEEEIYMEHPKGFVVASQEHLVYWLKKSLYDLKQAPKQWYKKLLPNVHNGHDTA